MPIARIPIARALSVGFPYAMMASGIAVAKIRTQSANARVMRKTPDAVRRAAVPKRRSRRWYAVSWVPSKYPGSKSLATPIRPIK